MNLIHFINCVIELRRKSILYLSKLSIKTYSTNKI